MSVGFSGPNPDSASGMFGTTGEVAFFGTVSDLPVDQQKAIKDALTILTNSAVVPSGYTGGAATPSLVTPNFTQAKDGFTPPTSLPVEGDPEYEAIVAIFTPPNGSKEQAKAAYEAFLSKFPPDSPQYKALLNSAFVQPSNLPQLGQNVEVVNAARAEIFKEQGVLPPSMDGLFNDDGTLNITPKQFAELLTVGTFQGLEASGVQIDTSTVDQAEQAAKAPEELLNELKSRLDKLPDSPEKTSMLNYLKEVSAAIIEFTKILQQMQTTDSGKNKEINSAKLDDTLDKLEKQHEAMEKQQKASSKSHKKSAMNVFNKIIKGITIALMVVAAAVLMYCAVITSFLVPLNVLLAMASIALMAQAVDMCMKMAGAKQGGVWDNAAKATDAIVHKFGEAVGMSDTAIEKLQKATKVILIAVVISVLCLTGTYMYGGTEAMKGVLFDTGMITDPKVKLIVGIAMDVAAFAVNIAIMIAISCIPGCQGMIAGMIGQLTKFVADLTRTTVTIVKTVVQIVKSMMELAMTALTVASVASAANQIALAKIKMELNRAMGDLESDIQLREMIINLLKKLLESLQAMIGNASEQVKVAMQGLETMWGDASNAINNLTSSSSV